MIDLSQPSGKRVKSIHARCGYCTVPVYEPLDLNANYTIIISKFLSEGGDSINFKKVVEYQSLGKYYQNNTVLEESSSFSAMNI